MSKKFFIILSLSVVFFGLIGIVGWILNIGLLESLVPGFPTMKFNTAVGIFLSGIALYRHQTNKKKNLTSLISYFILFIGAASVSQDILDVNLGIDQLLFIDTQSIAEGGANPGRMSPLTAVCIFFIGLSSLLQGKNDNMNFYSGALFITLVISFFSLISYLFNIGLEERAALLYSMSIPTSIAIFLLGLGFSFLKPYHGIIKLFLSESLGGKLARQILSLFLLIILFSFYISIQLNRFKILEGENGRYLFLICTIIAVIFIIWNASRQLNRIDSKRLQAEMKLKTLNDQLQLQIQNKDFIINTIFQSPDILIISLDPNGLITNFSKGAEIKLGYTEAEVKGKFGPELWINHIDFERDKAAKSKNLKIFPDFRKMFQPPFLKDETFITTFSAKDGSTFKVQLTTNSILDTKGEFVGSIGIALDITDSLEKKELELTAENLEKQNQLLTNFSSIVSHDFRSPLKNLEHLMDMFENSNNQEDRDIYYTTIKKIITRMNLGFGELLESIKKNELVPKNNYVYFDTVLSDIKEVLSSQIIDSNAKITSDFREADRINYPSILIESIFLNLCSNSIKYKSKGRDPLIHIESTTENEYVKLKFTDNGSGFDLARDKDEIFKLNKTFHDHEDSKGVGLFMTKQQIESKGGKIFVESELGEGTTFTILLKKDL